jgi:hypothetical protein
MMVENFLEKVLDIRSSIVLQHPAALVDATSADKLLVYY